MGQDGHIGLKVLVGQAGFHRTVLLVLHETGWIHWTVLCILHRICGISRNPQYCPTCLFRTWDCLGWTRNFDGILGHE